MITKLQNFFLKHNKILFGGLLIVIIVTFVLTIGPQSIFGGGPTREQRELNFFGYNLSSDRDRTTLIYEAEISAMLNPELRMRRNQLQDYAYLRAAGLGIARQLGIPGPTQEELQDFIESRQVFQDPESGEFSAESYNRTLEVLNSTDRYSEGDLARVMRQDYQISKVREALSGPLYLLDHDLLQAYISRETSYDVATATYSYRDFSPDLNPTREDLRAFYEENPGVYEEPTKIDVTALFFEAEHYLDEVEEPSDAELENYFSRNQSRYQPDPPQEEESEEEVEVPEVTLADVRDEVVEDWKLAEAKQIAGTKAETFSLQLWEQKIEAGSEAFLALVDSFEVNRVPVTPYPRGEPPSNPRIPRELLNSMWIYENSSRYFSDLAQNRDGAVLLTYNETVDSYLPSFEEVRTEVRRNWLEQEKRRLFAEKGESLRSDLMAALTAGESFVDAAESLRLTVDDPESFKGSEVPANLRRSPAWSQGQYLADGGLTSMVISGQEGTFLYMQKKDAPEVTTESEAFLAYKEEQISQGNEFAGWSRLREITDTTLDQVLGRTENPS